MKMEEKFNKENSNKENEEINKQVSGLLDNMDNNQVEQLANIIYNIAKLQSNGKDFMTLMVLDKDIIDLRQKITLAAKDNNILCEKAIDVYKQCKEILDNFCNENNL